MDDTAIIDLFWARSEEALVETDRKYGRLCFQIARNVLSSNEDAEETVSDTYLTAWNKLPPLRPAALSAFLAKVVRYISIDRWRAQSTAKRGGGQVPLALDELSECVSGTGSAEDSLLTKELSAALNRFLDSLDDTERTVFLRRYFGLQPVKVIGESFGFSESKVKSMLLRTRQKLRRHLQKEELL